MMVPLAPLREASLIPSAIAQTLGVRETPGQPLLVSLKSERLTQLLLILDNYEHLATAAPLVTELLAACPQLKIVVTSRKRCICVGTRVSCAGVAHANSSASPTVGYSVTV
ncbi:MAG: hypothetical protein U0350_33465 [Caldilineaceae bacterium]